MKNYNAELNFLTDILAKVKTRLFEITEDMVEEEGGAGTKAKMLIDAKLELRSAISKIDSVRIFGESCKDVQNDDL